MEQTTCDVTFYLGEEKPPKQQNLSTAPLQRFEGGRQGDSGRKMDTSEERPVRPAGDTPLKQDTKHQRLGFFFWPKMVILL